MRKRRRPDEEGFIELVIREATRDAPRDGYVPVTLATGRGKVACRYYPVEGATAGAVWVGGVGGGFDTPAKGMYPALCEELTRHRIASLRVRYRHPTVLQEAVHDVLAGILFLEREGVLGIALTGHSFGGAVVIQAAAHTSLVKTVITLATQSYGADPVSDLAPDCSVLLIHGAEDPVLPSFSSERVYEMAHEPKELIILPHNGHVLDESAEEVERVVADWVVSKLNPYIAP